MAEKISALALYLLMLGMLLTGTLNTIFLKLQNSEDYYNKDKDKNMEFNHPFFQTFCMFVGEFLCLAMYAISYYRDTKTYGDVMQSPAMIDAKKKGLRTNINVVLLAIPACFDILASTLMFTALTMIAASIYQMMRGLIVFVVAIQSIIFLKRRFYRHHWMSLMFVVGGVGLVGASPIIFPDNGSSDNNNAILGIILLIIAQFFAGGLFIVEEKLLGNYYLHPMKVVGWEGFWGCFIYAILLFIMQFIPCDNKDICPYGKVEDTPQAFYEFGKNAWITIFAIGTVFSIAFFNAFGVAVTKNASAAQRSTIDTSRTLLIWIFFIIKPGKAHEKFIWLELVGFAMLVFGTFVFNEILVLPFLGLNQWTKAAIASRALAVEGKDEDNETEGLISKETTKEDNYIGNSPAQYDYQRNYTKVKNHLNKTSEDGSNVRMDGMD